MGVYAGPANAWSNFTDSNRIDASTKVVIQDGLVLNLDAGASTSYPGSGTSWTDLSGNGNTGTLVNGVGYDVGNRGSLSFDGVNDYINISNSFQVSTSQVYSALFWIYKTSTSINNSSVILSGGYGGDRDGIIIATEVYSTINNIRISSDNGSASAIYYNGISQPVGTNFNLNEWIHIAVTGITVPSVDGGNHNIGRNNNGTNYFKGNIATTQIYNRALTASEVQQNFNALRSRFGI